MAFWYCSSWAAYAATFSRHLLAELKSRTRAEQINNPTEKLKGIPVQHLYLVQPDMLTEYSKGLSFIGRNKTRLIILRKIALACWILPLCSNQLIVHNVQ